MYERKFPRSLTLSRTPQSTAAQTEIALRGFKSMLLALPSRKNELGGGGGGGGGGVTGGGPDSR